jgi:hypothetical protein
VARKCTARGGIRHFGDRLADNQVYEGTLPAAWFAEKNNVMRLNWKNENSSRVDNRETHHLVLS